MEIHTFKAHARARPFLAKSNVLIMNHSPHEYTPVVFFSGFPPKSNLDIFCNDDVFVRRSNNEQQSEGHHH